MTACLTRRQLTCFGTLFHVKQSTEARQLTPRQAGRHSLCLPAARANARDMATVKIAKTHHCNA